MKLSGYGSAAAESAPPLKTSVAGLIESSATSSTTSSRTPKNAEDTTSLSSGTASVRALTEAAFGSVSRADKVAALQQAVQSGRYTTDPVEIASALSRERV